LISSCLLLLRTFSSVCHWIYQKLRLWSWPYHCDWISCRDVYVFQCLGEMDSWILKWLQCPRTFKACWQTWPSCTSALELLPLVRYC
jgi:hypothetical protein